jgi:HSP20 family protein
MPIFKKIFHGKRNIKISEEKKSIANEDENSLPENWYEDGFEEGQLSIDVFDTPQNLVVKSTIAGVKPENLDISINEDILTVRGKRHLEEEISEENYLYRECYWGSFSRSLILPCEIKANKIKAELENGVLTIILPKEKPSKEINIKVSEI